MGGGGENAGTGDVGGGGESGRQGLSHDEHIVHAGPPPSSSITAVDEEVDGEESAERKGSSTRRIMLEHFPMLSVERERERDRASTDGNAWQVVYKANCHYRRLQTRNLMHEFESQLYYNNFYHSK